jgi:hypothetical protein
VGMLGLYFKVHNLTLMIFTFFFSEEEKDRFYCCGNAVSKDEL